MYSRDFPPLYTSRSCSYKTTTHLLLFHIRSRRSEGAVGLLGCDREGQADGRQGRAEGRQGRDVLQAVQRLQHPSLDGHSGELRWHPRGYRENDRSDEEVHQVEVCWIFVNRLGWSLDLVCFKKLQKFIAIIQASDNIRGEFITGFFFYSDFRNGKSLEEDSSFTKEIYVYV